MSGVARNDKHLNARVIPDPEMLSLIGEEDNALYLEACAVLARKNPTGYRAEHADIVGAALGGFSGTGTPRDLLRNIIAHLPNHTVKSITKTYEVATDAGLPEDVLLTDDHITVRWRINDHRKLLAMLRIVAPREHASPSEHKNIIAYAMRHIEDGPLIASLYIDRDMHTLHEIIDFLPTFRSAHRAINEGVL